LTTENYYTILEVTKESSDADIKKAYRRLSKKYHPDKNPAGEEQFKKISNAYSVIGDSKKRAEYDRIQSNPRPNSQAHDFRQAANFYRAARQEFEDLSYLNIQVDKHFKISELLNGIKFKVNYLISKVSLTADSKFEDKEFEFSINLSTHSYPIMRIGKDDIVLQLRVRQGGSSKVVQQYSFTGELATGTATGDLFVNVHIDVEGLEFSETADLIQTVNLSLTDVLFAEEIILESKSGKKYKVKSFNSDTLSDLQVRIPEQGLVSAFGQKGAYIFKIVIKKPNFSKFSEDTLTQFKDLLRELDK
jgi:DnaJ-class molecular chaperone